MAIITWVLVIIVCCVCTSRGSQPVSVQHNWEVLNVSTQCLSFVIKNLRKPLNIIEGTRTTKSKVIENHIWIPIYLQINAFMLRWLQWYYRNDKQIVLLQTFGFANSIMTVLLLLFSRSHRHSIGHYSVWWLMCIKHTQRRRDAMNEMYKIIVRYLWDWVTVRSQ